MSDNTSNMNTLPQESPVHQPKEWSMNFTVSNDNVLRMALGADHPINKDRVIKVRERCTPNSLDGKKGCSICKKITSSQ